MTKRLGQRMSQAGASQLELAVAIIMIAVLSLWSLHTLRFHQELTEKTVVESTITNLRSGLRFKIADLIIKGAGDKQLGLEKTNPVLFLEHPPIGYFGEMRAPGNLPPGSWYYEQDRAELVYIPQLSANLVLVDAARQEIQGLRWQLRAKEGSGVQVVDIELLTPYNWFK